MIWKGAFDSSCHFSAFCICRTTKITAELCGAFKLVYLLVSGSFVNGHINDVTRAGHTSDYKGTEPTAHNCEHYLGSRPADITAPGRSKLNGCIVYGFAQNSYLRMLDPFKTLPFGYASELLERLPLQVNASSSSIICKLLKSYEQHPGYSFAKKHSSLTHSTV